MTFKLSICVYTLNTIQEMQIQYRHLCHENICNRQFPRAKLHKRTQVNVASISSSIPSLQLPRSMLGVAVDIQLTFLSHIELH